MEVAKLKEVKVGGTDLTEFEGKRAKIEILSVIEVPSQYTETGKMHCLKVQTDAVTQFERDGENVDIRASELFNLKDDDKGNWGFSSSPKSKLQKFMRKQGVKQPDSLKGTQVTIRVRQKTNDDGTTTDFLGFVL